MNAFVRSTQLGAVLGTKRTGADYSLQGQILLFIANKTVPSQGAHYDHYA